MPYIYIQSEQYLWTVGHYSPDCIWIPESDHDSPEKALIRVLSLNGSTEGIKRLFNSFDWDTLIAEAGGLPYSEEIDWEIFREIMRPNA